MRWMNLGPIIQSEVSQKEKENIQILYTLDWLINAAKERQILLFTCHTREGEYLSGRDNVNCLFL